MKSSNNVTVIFPNAQFKSEIYINSSTAETKFSDDTQEELFAIEDNSWWFKYRAKVIYKIFEKYMDKKKVTIDIGGGNGFTTRFMEKKNAEMFLLEPTYRACQNAKKRGVNTVICGVLSENDVSDNLIPQAMLLDVLEHIEDDEKFLCLLNSKLCFGGGSADNSSCIKMSLEQ